MANKLRIFQSMNPENPREWDNFGTMAYKHRDYILGDESINDPIEWLEDKMGIPNTFTQSNERLSELEKRFVKEYIALPLYLYDHSGITMRTYPFDCRWDSGKVGYIYVSKEKVRSEFGWKVITAKRREQIEKYLRNEVKTFDQYITGDVYSFTVEDEDENVIDSCDGFFGSDWEMNGIKDHIDSELWPQLENIEVEYER
jgi:hypothetical protein